MQEKETDCLNFIYKDIRIINLYMTIMKEIIPVKGENIWDVIFNGYKYLANENRDIISISFQNPLPLYKILKDWDTKDFKEMYEHTIKNFAELMAFSDKFGNGKVESIQLYSKLRLEDEHVPYSVVYEGLKLYGKKGQAYISALTQFEIHLNRFCKEIEGSIEKEQLDVITSLLDTLRLRYSIKDGKIKLKRFQRPRTDPEAITRCYEILVENGFERPYVSMEGVTGNSEIIFSKDDVTIRRRKYIRGPFDRGLKKNEVIEVEEWVKKHRYNDFNPTWFVVHIEEEIREDGDQYENKNVIKLK